jgi:hypothetical protein
MDGVKCQEEISISNGEAVNQVSANPPYSCNADDGFLETQVKLFNEGPKFTDPLFE